MTRRPQLQSIQETLESITSSYKNNPAYQLALVQNAWSATLGEGATQKVHTFSVHQGVLHVHFHSDSLRHELSLQRSRLLVALNEALKGQIVLKDLVLQ